MASPSEPPAPPMSSALVHVPPAVAPPPPAISRSLDSSRPGELVLIDEEGQVLTPTRRSALQLRSWVMLGVWSGLLAAAGSILFQTALGMLWPPAVMLFLVGWRLRRTRDLRHVQALLAARRDEEAWEALDALERDGLVPIQRMVVSQLRGLTAWRLGRRQEAIAAFEQAVNLARVLRPGTLRVTGYICQFYRAQLLAIEGRPDLAMSLLPELSRAPKGDFLQMQRIALSLVLAFAGGSTAMLEADLYGWATKVLRTSRFGAMAAMLAWAFFDRGDEEMGRHMLTEAVPRLSGEQLARMHPALHDWFLDACARHQIAPDPPSDD